jgi:hypothetical protein
MITKAKQKIILILPILTLIFSLVCVPVFALTVSETGLETTAGEAELPEADITVVVGQVIAAAFSLVGVIFFLLLIYGGFLWMTSRGNEDAVKKAKDLLTNSIIGLLIVVAGYAISRFIIGLLLGGDTGEAPLTP